MLGFGTVFSVLVYNIINMNDLNTLEKNLTVNKFMIFIITNKRITQQLTSPL